MLRLTENDKIYALTEGKDAGKYWAYQEPLAKFGGAYKSGFLQSFKPCHAESVLEFGCSGGFIVGSIGNVSQRICVELSALARRKAAEDTRLSRIDMMTELLPSNEKYDFIYSTSVLEHCSNPLLEATRLAGRLAPRGVMLHLVINEGQLWDRDRYHSNPDNHLYTWTALNLGNMLTVAGTKVCACKQFYSSWPHTNLPQMIADRFTFCKNAEQSGAKSKMIHVACASVNEADLGMCSQVSRFLDERITKCDWADPHRAEEMVCSPY